MNIANVKGISFYNKEYLLRYSSLCASQIRRSLTIVVPTIFITLKSQSALAFKGGNDNSFIVSKKFNLASHYMSPTSLILQFKLT